MYKDKICPVCGNSFSPVNARAKYCSSECRRRAEQLREEEQKAKVQRICEWCGQSFHPRTNTQKYCDAVHYANCVICGKQFEIDLRKQDKRQTCSRECHTKLMFQKGNPFADPDSRAKAAYTMKQRYGVDNPMQNEQIKTKQRRTMLDKYGDWFTRTEDYLHKTKLTNQLRYGSDWPLQSDTVKAKLVDTLQTKYGVTNSMQVPGALANCQNTSMMNYGKQYPMQSDEVKSKMRATLENKYGVAHYSQTAEFKHKFKATMLDRYGADNPNRVKSIKERIAQTNLKRYGHVSALGSAEVRAKGHKTSLNKYGFSIYTQTAEWKQSRMLDPTKIDSWMKFLSDPAEYLKRKSEPPTYSQLEQELGVSSTTISAHIVALNLQQLIKYTLSTMEDEVVEFIQSVCPNELLVRHERSLIAPKELDIYLPNRSIAIECNPTVTHNSSVCDPWGASPKSYRYHRDKTSDCAAKDVFLFHIFGYEWVHKREIIESMIRNLLGASDRIYARNCEFNEVSSSEARMFLNENHRQGYTPAKYYFGLYYRNELVSLMTFGKLRNTMGKQLNSDNDWELVRFCNLLNTTVVGGASKLFKHFVDIVQPNKIVSFSDRAHTRGTLYGKLGFQHTAESDPSYVWVDSHDDAAYNRVNAQKRNLKQFLHDPDVDLTKTETQIMIEHGFVQVFDSGTIRWEWHRDIQS